jgi:hypothetical protein
MGLDAIFNIYRFSVSKLYLFVPILMVFAASCQDKEHQPSLIIHNLSLNAIDSVIIPCYKSKYEESRACSYEIKEKIYPEKNKSIAIDRSNYKISPFDIDFFASIYIYINGKKIITSWDPKPYEENNNEVENIYVTDKGVYPFNPKSEPEILRILIRDSTSKNKIDSIAINENMVESKSTNNRLYFFDLKYKAFKTWPVVKIYRNGKPVEIRIEYDWDNWIENFNPQYIIYDSGIVRNRN